VQKITALALGAESDPQTVEDPTLLHLEHASARSSDFMRRRQDWRQSATGSGHGVAIGWLKTLFPVARGIAKRNMPTANTNEAAAMGSMGCAGAEVHQISDTAEAGFSTAVSTLHSLGSHKPPGAPEVVTLIN